MRSARLYMSKLLMVPVAAICLTSGSATAVTLNFSATLHNGTCELNLNKSTLSLGSVPFSELRPAQIFKAQPFVLSVRNCTGSNGGSTTSLAVVTGTGTTQNGKWLFRNEGSANGLGIAVIESDSPPVYTQQEIKNGTALPLAEAGKNPVNQTHTFFAGLSCLSSDCGSAVTGNVTATLMFTFAYQ